MILSPHFIQSEFERDGCSMPPEVVPAYTALCVEILEPMRVHFAQPFITTSGYRDKEANKRVTRKDVDSQHIATAERAAVDGFFNTYQEDMRPVFDWLRLESGLPFDQVILEHGKYGDVVHISWSKTPRRMALEGKTFHQSGYTAHAVAPIPPEGSTAV